jgi:hypothetical protein
MRADGAHDLRLRAGDDVRRVYLGSPAAFAGRGAEKCYLF